MKKKCFMTINAFVLAAAVAGTPVSAQVGGDNNDRMTDPYGTTNIADVDDRTGMAGNNGTTNNMGAGDDTRATRNTGTAGDASTANNIRPTPVNQPLTGAGDDDANWEWVGLLGLLGLLGLRKRKNKEAY